RAGWATFDRNLQESLLRSTAPQLEEFSGHVWHEPLPLDHAREDAPLIDLLSRAAKASNVATNVAGNHVALRLLYAPRAVLAVLINETSVDGSRKFTIA